MSDTFEREIRDLIQGEKAAVETYKQAIDKISDRDKREILSSFKQEHENFVNDLTERAKNKFVQVPTSSGAWGTWAKAVEGTANLLGEKASLTALKKGEEHGLKLYKKTRDADEDPELQSLIQGTFIPRTNKHIQQLDSMIHKM